MNIPDWVQPVAEYVFRTGLVNTLKISAMALVGSTVIGILLGTLLTIRFLPGPGADSAVHRDLARPPDSRHHLHDLLPAAVGEPAAAGR